MVELIVVVVLIMLLGGGVVFGVTKWIEWSNYSRQNENARALYLAAQNQLTEYSESGQLEELQASLKDAGGEYEGTINRLVADGALIGADGSAYTEESLWPESAGKSDPAKYRGAICSIIGTADDYLAYVNDSADGRTKVLYDMLTSYLYDSSILNATVCVEFTPEDGQVLAVFYSDKNDDFTYEASAAERGTVSILNREAKELKKRMIGYYGVDMLYKSTKGMAPQPVMAECMLRNEDTLNLSFGLEEGVEPGQLNYEVTVYDQAAQEPVLMFVLDGSKLKSEEFRRTIPCDVTRYRYEADGTVKEQNIGTYNFLAWVDKDNLVRIVLDAVDFGGKTADYENVYNWLSQKDNTDWTFKDSQEIKKIKQNLSFMRFGVQVEDIYCTVEGSGTGFQTMAKKTSNVENTMFDAVQMEENEGEKTAVYSIKNARHLYNVRYLEDYTDSERTAMGYEKTADQIVYQFEHNVDWNSFVKGGSVFENGAGETDWSGNGIHPEPLENVSFPSFKQLRERNVFGSKGKEKVYTVSGLTIDAATNNKMKVYGDSWDTQNKPFGMFIYNYGTIQNLTLDKVKVESQQASCVGAFCGLSAGALKNLTVNNTDSESVVKGLEKIGGIVGANDTKTAELLWEELENHANIQIQGEWGKKAYGGIAGIVSAEGTQKIQIKDCRNYGTITVSAGEVSDIGGVIGRCQVTGAGELTVESCLSAPQYTAAQRTAIDAGGAGRETFLKGTNVGGIVGYNNGAKILKCSSEPESGKGYRKGYVLGGENVGGIVGDAYLDGKTLVLDGETDGKSSVNDADVYGKKNVGGIIGFNRENIVVKNWMNTGKVESVGEYAGGIAGDNYGEIILNPEKSPSCEVKGKAHVGGITGFNHQKGRITLVGGIEVKVEAAEQYAGGAAGENLGSISKGQKPGTISGSVEGGSYVGGIAGTNGNIEGTSPGAVITGLNSSAEVTAEKGYAGGIAGFNHGGIAEGRSSGNVTAKNGLSGGICAENGKEYNNNQGVEIVDCQVETEKEADTLTVESVGKAGGITAVNRSAIRNSSVKRTKVVFKGSVQEPHIGGVTAENTSSGSIVNCNVGEAARKLSLTSGLENVQIGGVAGVNQGVIQGGSGGSAADSYSHVYADIIPEGAGNIGGIAGRNERTIYGYAFSGEVRAEKNLAQNGCGGITGINRTTDGLIQGCMVANACISGTGTVDNIAYVGGVAGKNEASASILEVTFGALDAGDTAYHPHMTSREKLFSEETAASVYVGTMVSNQTAAYGYVGGVAGSNAGTIRDIYAGRQSGNAEYLASADQASVIVENQAGNVGGIVGYNQKGSTLTRVETGRNWVVAAAGHAADSGCGGVVGRQMQEDGISEWINRATVEKSVQESSAVGGVIGLMKIDQAERNYQISQCDNYGKIYGRSGAGGIVGWMETKGQITYQIADCKNYAKIQGGSNAANLVGGGSAGGIVGVWKGRSGQIADCINYGDVSAYQYGSGGVVGKIGSPVNTYEKYSIQVDNCQNHGKILSGKLVQVEDAEDTAQTNTEPIECGGILGGTSGENEIPFNVIVQISGCVNTGLISAGNLNGGIIGITTNLSADSSILYCNNYGYGYGNVRLGGIVPFKLKVKMTVKNCIGVALTSYPIGKNGGVSDTDCYYIGAKNSVNGNAVGTPVTVAAYSDGGYSLLNNNKIIGIPGFPINPNQAFADAYAGNPDNLLKDNNLVVVTGQGEDNIRYKVFLADQEYFNLNSGKTFSLNEEEAKEAEEAEEAGDGTAEAEEAQTETVETDGSETPGTTETIEPSEPSVPSEPDASGADQPETEDPETQKSESESAQTEASKVVGDAEKAGAVSPEPEADEMNQPEADIPKNPWGTTEASSGGTGE